MKKIVSVLVCLLLVFELFPTVILAGVSGKYAVALHVEENSDVKYLEKNTYEVSFGVQSDDLKIKGPQVFCFAVDLTAFDLLTFEGNPISVDTLTTSWGSNFVDGVYKVHAYDSRTNWGMAAYYAVSSDKKTAYVSLQPYLDGKEQSLTTEVRLESILVGLKEGKTVSDLSESSIRMLTVDEADALGENVVLLGDGTTTVKVNKDNPTSEMAASKVDWSAVALEKDAETPTISTQPSGASYYKDATATALSVTASVSDGGTLSYQWYSNTENSTTGGTSVATTATYTPSTATLGTTYYYVAVTNTNNDATGKKTASVTSNVVAVTVSEDPDLVALAGALTTVGGLTYTMAQADVVTEDSIKTYIKTTAEAAVATGITVSETAKVEYTAAVAGTSADADGTNGSYVFTLTLAKNGKTATTSGTLTVTITATQYSGITDKQAVAAAKAGIAGGNVNVGFKADADAKKKAVEGYVATELAKIADAAGVEATVALKEDTTYTVTFSKGSESEANDITITFVEAPDPDIAVVGAAKTAAGGASYADMKQADATSEDVIKSALKTAADTAIANGDVTAEIVKVSYTEAVAGTSASPSGTNGTYTFKVKVSKGEQSAETEEKSITINATVFDGVTDEQAVELAKTAVDGLTWEDIAEADANTEDAVRKIIENKAKTAIANESVTVTVTVSNFTAAVAGSAATSHDGTNGGFKFTVKVEKGAHNHTTTEKSLKIVATAFTGVLDTEAVAAAKDAVVNGEVNVAFGADQEAKEAAVQSYVNSIISKTEKAAGVTAVVTYVSGSSYIVEYTKNAASDLETIEMTVTEAEDPDIAVITEAQGKVDGIVWQDIAQTLANTEADVKQYIKDVVDTGINNEEITVTVTVSSFTAAVAGSAATSHEGTDGAANFTVKIEKGARNYTTPSKTLNILATEYAGVLDSEAIAAAQLALDGMTWENIAQADANTAEAVKAYIEDAAKKAVGDETVTVAATVTNFTAAVAGSAATSHEGTNGGFRFTVKATIGAKEYTTAEKELAITATAFEGVLDTEAVAAAKAAIVGGNVNVAFGADDTAKASAVRAYLNAFLTGDADGVTATVTGVVGSEYTVSLVKNAASDTTTVTLTIVEAIDPDIALVANAKNAAENATYADVAEADINTEAAAKEYIKGIAEKAVDNNGIVVSVETVSFTAAVAGSADTTHEGTDGEFKFKVKVEATKGNPSDETTEKTIAVTATKFEGILNQEAVDAAANALVNKEIIVRHGASSSEKDKAAEDYIKSVLTGTASGVTATVKNRNGNEYTVEFSKGTKTAEKTVTIAVEEEKFIDLAKANGLTYDNRVLSWNAVPHTSYYKVYVMVYPSGDLGHCLEYVTLTNSIDMTPYLVEGLRYCFAVQAMGDWVTYADGPVSETSAPFVFENASAADAYNWWIMYQLSNIKNTELKENDKPEDKDEKVETVDEPTIEKTEWVNPFTDVSENDGYYEAVKFVNENKLFLGVSETEFAPHKTMTRGMFVTVLGRLAGVDESLYTGTSFDDAIEGEWYAAYVEWAAENGIVNGYGNGKFGVNDEVTVEQATAIIARYARFMGISTDAKFLTDFDDLADLADWATDDMAWAVENGIYAGSEGKLNSKTKAERALVAEMLYGFVNATAEAE